MRAGVASLPIVIDSAVSSDASILRGQFFEIFHADQLSAALGVPVERLTVRLHQAAEEASSANWDGYGAEAANTAALEFAQLLIPLLPRSYDPPDIDIEPDGEVSFEWQTASRTTFSFSIETVRPRLLCRLDGAHELLRNGVLRR